MEKKTNTLKKALTGIILSVILIVIDQVTKLMAIHGLMNQQPFVIWDGVFELHYLENRGAAFGILQGKKIFFVVFTLIVLCLIAYLYLKRIPDEKKFRPMDGICILFFAGALGNFIDRVFRNYVVDFFYFKLIDFPVFNVADIYVTVAAFAMIILGLSIIKKRTIIKFFMINVLHSKYADQLKIRISDMQKETFEVEYEYEGERLDKYVSILFPEQSRSFFQKLIKDGNVSVNDKIQKANYRLKTEDLVTVEIPDAVETQILPEDIPLDILYEDDDLLVVNKPKGMVVHPSAGHYSGTLVNAIMYHCKDSLSGINGEIRPGIVHRIDMDTTGSLIVCKNDESHVFIAEQIKEHSVNRRYRGIVYGVVRDDEGTIHAPIGRHPFTGRKWPSMKKMEKMQSHTIKS